MKKALGITLITTKKTKIGIATALTTIIIFSAFSAILMPITISEGILYQFYDPLGSVESWSFEYIGSSILEPPPSWSVSGGQRFLGTDLDANDKCDENDLNILLESYGKSNGEPDYNPNADFDNNGRIDEFDLSLLSKNLGKVKHALHGDYSWTIGGPGNHTMSRYVESHCLPALKLSLSQSFVFGFWYLLEYNYTDDAACRAEVTIGYVTGQSQTYEGVWIVPVYSSWTPVYVHVQNYFGPSIESIKVVIRCRDLKAYIDSARLGIFDHAEEEGAHCSLSVGVNLYSFRIDQGMTLDGIVRASPALYVEATNGYKIKWVELKVTKLFEDGAFNLNIPYCTQGNDKGYEIDPAAEERKQSDQLFAASIMVPFAVTALLTFGVGGILEGLGLSTFENTLIRFTASTTFGAFLKFLMPHFASDTDHKTADGGGLGNAVWENWPYPSIDRPVNFVNSVSASFDLDWCFDIDSADCFGINIELTVCVGYPEYLSYPYWTLIYEEEYTRNVYLAINP